jgi:hypothetical protein
MNQGLNLNTKQIGNIGESAVLAKFCQKGIPVYQSFGDNEKADLIAEFHGKLNKIQVKTCLHTTNGCSEFHIDWKQMTNGSRHRAYYTSSDIDYFALYSVERDKIFLVPIQDVLNKDSIIIRFQKPKNNQLKGIIFEDTYFIDNVI